MKLMEDKILSDGVVLPGRVLKVGSFLNQQVDVGFMYEVCREISEMFKDEGINKVLTIESSGIPMATLAALLLGAKCVVVKKHASANISDNVYSAEISSYTHHNTYTAVVEKEYIQPGDCFLIVDDFLAIGNAVRGMIDIISQAGATLAGCAIAVEKVFQGGGKLLREEGIRVESLAMIEEMTDDGHISFCR